MPREVLFAALDRILRTRRDAITVLFNGGEPLLEFALVREAILYLEGKLSRRKRLRIALNTNGALLTPAVVAFLSSHDVQVQLSFDGVPRAQALRGRSTFAILDRRLRMIRRRDPHFHRENLSISVTVTPATIGYMADSVDYFIGLGIQEIALSPVMGEMGVTGKMGETGETGETGVGRGSRGAAAVLDALDRQFERIHRASLDHSGRSGEVPVVNLRRSGGRRGSAPDPGDAGRDAGASTGGAMCRLTEGRMLAVEPSGRAVPCLMFAQTNASPVESALSRRLALLDCGDIRDPAFESRFSRLPEALEACGIFTGRKVKRSSFRRCEECPDLDMCIVCPAAIALAGGRDGPHRIPDFYCAFNAVSLKWRRRFPPVPSLRDLADDEWPL